MTVSADQFGRDHWSLFAYVECRVVDHRGIPDRTHLRCDPARHPAHAHEGSRHGGPFPTRLADGVLLPNHDDWDCLDDLEAAGLLSSHGTGVNPWFKLTRKGLRVAALLRAHKAKGGQFAEFRFAKPRRRKGA